MNLEDKVRGCYYGWFFGTGGILRKDLTFNYQKIYKKPEYANIDSFEEIPNKYKMYDQLTQTKIIHDLITEYGKATPELFKDRLLELNKKYNVIENDQYGPSTTKAVKKLLDGADPRETGKRGVTIGGVMRCMPVGVYFSGDESKILDNTTESCIITHNSDVTISGAQIVNLTISNLLQGLNWDKSLKNSLETVKKVYGNYGVNTAFAHIYKRISDAVEWVKGQDKEKAIETIAKRIGFSWYTIEAVPAGYAMYEASDNPKEAALLAFKSGYGHTAPQLASAFYGAQKGPDIFPEETMKKIEEVNDIDIDQMVDEMIKARS